MSIAKAHAASFRHSGRLKVFRHRRLRSYHLSDRSDSLVSRFRTLQAVLQARAIEHELVSSFPGFELNVPDQSA
ncbi:MAG: hypothetical protein ACLFNQ_11165 [Spirochaetaceae bacterium]